MTPFIERIIFDRLKDGLQPYLDDPKLFEKFLLSGGIKADEAARARTYFEGDATADPPIAAKPPHPIMGYARPGGPFPAWAIILGNENTAQDYLGEDGWSLDDEGELFVDEDGNPIDNHIRRWEHRYDIYTYVDHGDVCLYYYQLCKHILVSGRSVFQAADLDEITYTGAELAPDARWLPHEVYIRRFSMTLKADNEYEETEKPGIGIGRRVQIRIDDGEPLSALLTESQKDAIEQIKAGVTTYFVGE